MSLLVKHTDDVKKKKRIITCNAIATVMVIFSGA